MFKVRLLEEISAWEVIFIPVTTGKKGEFMTDEGKKHLDREIPEDSLKVFGLVFEKCYWKMLYFNQTFFILLHKTIHIQKNFSNHQSSFITQGSEKLALLENKECNLSFIVIQ